MTDWLYKKHAKKIFEQQKVERIRNDHNPLYKRFQLIGKEKLVLKSTSGILNWK